MYLCTWFVPGKSQPEIVYKEQGCLSGAVRVMLPNLRERTSLHGDCHAIFFLLHSGVLLCFIFVNSFESITSLVLLLLFLKINVLRIATYSSVSTAPTLTSFDPGHPHIWWQRWDEPVACRRCTILTRRNK